MRLIDQLVIEALTEFINLHHTQKRLMNTTVEYLAFYLPYTSDSSCAFLELKKNLASGDDAAVLALAFSEQARKRSGETKRILELLATDMQQIAEINRAAPEALIEIPTLFKNRPPEFNEIMTRKIPVPSLLQSFARRSLK